NKLRIHFARPLAADLAIVPRRIDTYIADIAMAGDSDVVATLTRPVGLHSFTLDDKVAIDLLDKPGMPKTPASAAPATRAKGQGAATPKPPAKPEKAASPPVK